MQSENVRPFFSGDGSARLVFEQWQETLSGENTLTSATSLFNRNPLDQASVQRSFL